mmetsp:Transcript_6734/g.13837  ORF Transcript_6734/g.13837 Transcript_6734/m.13837 type:complete len:320 (-) Transcript_6734:84-1043(-)
MAQEAKSVRPHVHGRHHRALPVLPAPRTQTRGLPGRGVSPVGRHHQPRGHHRRPSGRRPRGRRWCCCLLLLLPVAIFLCDEVAVAGTRNPLLFFFFELEANRSCGGSAPRRGTRVKVELFHFRGAPKVNQPSVVQSSHFLEQGGLDCGVLDDCAKAVLRLPPGGGGGVLLLPSAPRASVVESVKFEELFRVVRRPHLHRLVWGRPPGGLHWGPRPHALQELFRGWGHGVRADIHGCQGVERGLERWRRKRLNHKDAWGASRGRNTGTHYARHSGKLTCQRCTHYTPSNYHHVIVPLLCSRSTDRSRDDRRAKRRGEGSL